ncbi:MAG TPA: S41 family peptidase [Bacteroidota bacterium]|nr:S41 family peptidase [Bacteroidota bacterium]
MKRRFSTLTVMLFCVLALILGMQLNNLISGDTIFDQLNKFKDVLSYTEKYYVDNVDTPKLVETAITGMLGSLDPHSVYIPASELTRVEEDFQGSFEGIGVEYDVVNDTLVVVSPLPGGPSEGLGILAWDKIVKINDSNAVGIKREDVPKKLRGPKGTHVKVSIFRPGEKTLLDFDITRDKIPLYSVDVSYMIDGKTGYVSVNRFSQTTSDEFTKALAKLRSEGMKQLVIDLRNNPGGYLDQAFKMVNELLPGGKKIVYTKGRRTEFNEEYSSDGTGKSVDLPLVVLVNAGSASASEIVSGAIQDWDRGLIVGETTFGKGLVQRQYDLPDKSAFRLTIARYYTPSGRLIQRPYGKDFSDYTRAPFVRNEQEGENVEHNEERDSTRPVFKTASGRPVYGGGGITPDYIVKAEIADTLFRQFLAKGVFREFALDFIDKEGAEIRQRYDLRKFKSDFEVSAQVMNDFKALGVKKGIVLREEQYAKEKDVITTRVRAEIARAIWGNEGAWRLLETEDNQLQKALTLFPEAARIAKLE